MNTNHKIKIAVTLEKKDGFLWGIEEGKGNFIPSPYGKTAADVIHQSERINFRLPKK